MNLRYLQENQSEGNTYTDKYEQYRQEFPLLN